jgi:methylated-DNA-[protein]-cysteine S-methyltransferase
MQAVIDRVLRLLAGEPIDLSDVPLDFGESPDFHKRAYAIARTIPPGQTLTYGEVAARLEAPNQARAVGQALGQNPFLLVVPCHRVVAAGAKTGGFSATGGVDTKLRLLAIEGAQVGAACPLFDRPGGETLPTQVRPSKAAR